MVLKSWGISSRVNSNFEEDVSQTRERPSGEMDGTRSTQKRVGWSRVKDEKLQGSLSNGWWAKVCDVCLSGVSRLELR